MPMYPPRNNSTNQRRRQRPAVRPALVGRARGGFTLAELLMSAAIMGMVALAMAALSTAVRGTKQYTDGQSLATQHARVTLQRIENAVNQATTSADFPGFAVFSATVGSYTFPDTLVVWRPNGAAANPAGPPLFQELAIYCPNPAAPNQLWEITVPGDTRPTPALTDVTSWQTDLAAIKSSTTSTTVLLTDLMRVGDSSSGAGSGPMLRGSVRFRAVVRPSATDWSSYKSGSLAWTSLAWPQDLRGSQTGLRQSWCSIELQLMPGSNVAAQDPAGTQALAFFGSAALYYELQK